MCANRFCMCVCVYDLINKINCNMVTIIDKNLILKNEEKKNDSVNRKIIITL